MAATVVVKAAVAQDEATRAEVQEAAAVVVAVVQAVAKLVEWPSETEVIMEVAQKALAAAKAAATQVLEAWVLAATALAAKGRASTQADIPGAGSKVAMATAAAVKVVHWGVKAKGG